MDRSKQFFVFTLVFIAVLSLWIRISYFQQTIVNTPIRGDARQYVLYANNIVQNGTFSLASDPAFVKPDSYRSPGYPFLIALSILGERVLGVNSYNLLMYTQAILGVLIALISFMTARLFLTTKWSVAPALLVALSPHMISLGNNILSETLYSFLLLVAVYCFSYAFVRGTKWPLFVSGLFFGLAYLANQVVFFAPLLLVVAAIIYFYKKNEKIVAERSALISFVIIFFIVVGAWTARNIINVPAGQSSGSSRLLNNLVVGAHSDFYDIYRAGPQYLKDNPVTEDEKIINGSYKTFVKLMFGRIKEDPGHYLKWYMLDKPLLLWSWNILVGQDDIYVFPVIESLYQKSRLALASYSIMKSLHYWLLSCSVLGIFYLLKNGERAQVVLIFNYVVLVYMSFVYVVTQAEPRYSIPFRPEMYLCAVFFLSKTTEYLSSIRDRIRQVNG